jgi:hypothetical protein
MVVSKQITKKSSSTTVKVKAKAKAKESRGKQIFKQIFFSENTKMYIHIFLYVVVIILLSVALTGNWIILKNDNVADGYIRMLIKLDLFSIDARYEIGLKKMFSKLFDTAPKVGDFEGLIQALRDAGNTELADKIDALIKEGQTNILNALEEEFFKQFDDPVLHIKQKLISFDFKEIRDEYLKFGNLFYNMEFDKYQINFVLKDHKFNSENYLDGPKISMRLIKQVNNFNKPRLATDDTTFEFGDDDSDEVKLKKYNDAIQYVKDGELKKLYKDMQNQIILFAMCMQIITILSIVALGAHVLIILFKGRLTKRIRASSVLTVFLPLILLLIPTIAYLFLISQGITIATDNYLLFTVATLLLALTWLLGLFKII